MRKGLCEVWLLIAIVVTIFLGNVYSNYLENEQISEKRQYMLDSMKIAKQDTLKIDRKIIDEKIIQK